MPNIPVNVLMHQAVCGKVVGLASSSGGSARLMLVI
jgi:hypothetical protein